MGKQVLLPYISCVFLIGIAFTGCKARKGSDVKATISGNGIDGYAQPGKGFKLLERKVMENVCVRGDNGNLNDVAGQPSNQDPNARPTPTDPNIPPPITTDPNNPNTGFPTGTPGTPGTPTTPGFPSPGTPGSPGTPNINTPGTPNPGVPVDPYVGSPFFNANVDARGNPTSGKLGVNKSNYKGSVSAGPTSGVLGSGGADQGGNSQVTLAFYSSTKDVRSAIDATLSDTGSGSFTKGDAKIDVGGTIEGNLHRKLQDTKEYVYIFIHGRKTFGRLNSDVLTNPVFNKDLTASIFGDAIPETPKAIEDAFNEFRTRCGNTYIESVVRGREAWLVATMDRSVFNKIVGGKLDVGVNGGFSSPTIGEAKNDLKTGLSAEATNALLKQTVQYEVVSRGKSELIIKSYALEDVMTAFNQFMISGNGDGEGVIELSYQPYNNVRLVLGGKERFLGKIFTADIADQLEPTSSFVTLSRAKEQAAKIRAKLWNTYGMDQWSLSNNFYNGIAKQFNLLRTYENSIADLFSDCAEGLVEQSSASKECRARADALAKVPMPQVTFPPVRTQKLNIYVPKDTFNYANPSYDGYEIGKVTKDNAKAECESAGYRLPTPEDWENIVQTSYFYTQWQISQNMSLNRENKPVTSYVANNDNHPLALMCGRFAGGHFWVDAPDNKVIEIGKDCNIQANAMKDIPREFKFTHWIFWSVPMSNVVCVKYTADDNKPKLKY